VLYVGRLAAEKNLELARKAFQDIASSLPDVRFVLVGDGPELLRLRHAHPELILTGAKRGIELAEHYASGDLFLFPSLTETFGNVVPEAMASGLPVVAFDYAAAGAYIRSWQNGIKVPKGDAGSFREAATAAFGNGAALEAMAKCARVTAEGMSWSRILGDLEERFVDTIERHKAEQRCVS
jgi:glycosyltransferase involved in cell wall biosynthesis